MNGVHANTPTRPQHLQIPKFHREIYRDTLIIISPNNQTTPMELISTTSLGQFSYWEEEEREYWTPTPTKFRCRECKIEVTSEVLYVNGGTSVKVCLIIVTIIGSFAFVTLGASLLLLPLALIPLVVRRWKDVKHRCPGCKMPQGLFKRKIWKSEIIVQDTTSNLIGQF